jgi:hypothetical protein
MQVDLSRGALRLHAVGQAVMPLTSPINDLIGLRTDHTYNVHLYDAYFSSWPTAWFEHAPHVLGADDEAASDSGRDSEENLLDNVYEAMRKWRDERLPRLFLDAARRAESGHYSGKLGPHFERVERHPDGIPDEIPDGDLPALAAWTLDQALRLWPLRVVECPRCRLPWLTQTTQVNPFCLRPAPDMHTSCRTLAREQQYRTDHRPWRREYKRLHERTRRGTLSEHAFTAWKAGNAAGVEGIDWQPYDQWKLTQDAKASTSSSQHENVSTRE